MALDCHEEIINCHCFYHAVCLYQYTWVAVPFVTLYGACYESRWIKFDSLNQCSTLVKFC